MIIRVVQKNTRQTPRKIRFAADTVRGLSIEGALKQLAVIERRSALVLLKVFRQALANAQHNHNLSIDQLKIKSIQVNEGARYKRFRAVSRGRAHGIVKLASHVSLELEEVAITQPTDTTSKAITAKSSVKKAPTSKKKLSKK
ncbi:MAG: 50S ribosomal protein L22 [Candidatus Pacebacteria bacterium RIFCSPHIGHO2_01_FULL_46_16]|nr:MAG: 50S ribosomal protein L22 [Candidatus Pacebacteria bacterium RIFCSPHIGHO2_01_FULL_46_16]OGJ22034.1 MAG: 50S ribosomal protein L22 [Candidatus Pacebacteria bacterium RIFCSPHIGHO2_02_FULL_46_9]OGJ38241.1 MAG: 50S ribosomal protein L22 [Candidatus Pacebacteria bacterium RIFCSPLOWO2_01_FULL_47_12]